jgi:hypothetical protein
MTYLLSGKMRDSISKSGLIQNILMKNLTRLFLILLVFLSVLAVSSCTASHKSKCGCPSKTGMVGY